MVVSFGCDENVLNIAVIVAQLCEYTKKPTELYTLKGWNFIAYEL